MTGFHSRKGGKDRGKGRVRDDPLPVLALRVPSLSLRHQEGKILVLISIWISYTGSSYWKILKGNKANGPSAQQRG